MKNKNKTYQVVLSTTIKACQDLPEFRFISYQGTLCTNSAKAFGVTMTGYVKSEFASVINLGTIVIETSESIAIGDNVTSDSSGKARIASNTDQINGRALDSCTNSDYIRILLTP